MVSRRGLHYFIYILFIYGWLSANMPMPVLPQLFQLFDTSHTAIKLSVTVFLFGFAATQLIWGPLSDKHGRRKMLLAGFTITIFGALMAALSINIEMFLAARFIEAVGMGCGPVVARSIIMDSFNKKEITHVIAMSAVIVGIMPAVAPIIGGWLSMWLTWHSIFYFLVIYGIALWVFALMRLHESNLELDRELTPLKSLRVYRSCFQSRQFTSSLILYGLYYGLQLGYYTAAPFIFITHLHYSKEYYGGFMLFTVVSYMLGAYVSKHVLKVVSLRTMIFIAMMISILGLLLMVVFDFVAGLTTLTVIMPMMIVIAGSGAISPPVNTLAMSVFKTRKGAAAALLGFSMVGFSAIFSGIMALVHNDSLIPLIGMLLLVNTVGFLVFFRFDGATAKR